MKNNIEKIYNIVTATCFSLYSLIAIILLIFLPKYNILFPGWWTMIIILPTLGKLLFHKKKLASIYLLTIGILFLIASNEILKYNKCFTILLCFGIIMIGINIVKATLKIPKKNNCDTNSIPFYYAFIGVTEEQVTTDFKGGYSKVLFGNVVLDLTKANILDNSI